MAKSTKERSKSYYINMLKKGFKRVGFWIHDDDIKDVSAYVDSKKSDRRKLLTEDTEPLKGDRCDKTKDMFSK